MNVVKATYIAEITPYAIRRLKISTLKLNSYTLCHENLYILAENTE